MLGLEFFTEIVVVGFLFALAVLPLVKWQSYSDPLPPNYQWISREKPLLAAIALILVYVLGVIGNRISSGVTTSVPIDPKSRIESIYGAWAADKHEAPKRLKLAEFAVREKSESTAAWSERRRSYIRIVRGLFVAALVHTILLGVQCINVRSNSSPKRLFIGVAITAVAYSVFYAESVSYWRLIAELSGMPGGNGE